MYICIRALQDFLKVIRPGQPLHLVTQPKFENHFKCVTTVVSMPSFCRPVACGANPLPVPLWP